MAEQVLPQHRPHEQLRTEPAAQREHTDKYVTSFESGKSEVDITFTNPVLNESADHFKVGVDELTVNLGKVSMLDFGTNDIVFRVIRRGADDAHYDLDPELLMPDGPVGSVELYRESFEFKVDRPYASFQEVIDKFVDINQAVGAYFDENQIDTAHFEAEYDADFRGQPQSHISVSVNPKGQWVVMARQSFWANFILQVPLLKYRSIFFDDVDQEFLSLHPETGETRDPFVLEANGLLTTIPFLPQVTQNTFDLFAVNRALNRVFYATPSLFHTLDRRVTIEVSSSLPLKNSPMVDHGEEAPDYILGRYLFHKPIEVSTSLGVPVHTNFHSHGIGTQQLQGPKDRICYHHLKPQQKLLTLRLKLWLRVRTYDETKKKWGMRTIICPVKGPDYWHIRLHFTKK